MKNSHPGESRFKYRHEIFDNLEGIKDKGIENWIKEQIDSNAPNAGEELYGINMNVKNVKSIKRN